MWEARKLLVRMQLQWKMVRAIEGEWRVSICSSTKTPTEPIRLWHGLSFKWAHPEHECDQPTIADYSKDIHKMQKALRNVHVLTEAHTHTRTRSEWQCNRVRGCHLFRENHAFITLKCCPGYWSIKCVMAVGNCFLHPEHDVKISRKAKS